MEIPNVWARPRFKIVGLFWPKHRAERMANFLNGKIDLNVGVRCNVSNLANSVHLLGVRFIDYRKGLGEENTFRK